jgi:urease accessory protein
MWDTATNPAFLSLLQLCDSNLPTGAFSHSFGLETYIQDEAVHDKNTFARWLQVFLCEQLVYTDGLGSRLTYEALEAEDWEAVWQLDRLITVQNMARETREGTIRMGERMLQLGRDLYPSAVLDAYHERIKGKKSFGHPALVFAMIAQRLRVPLPTALLAYLYSTTATLIQNGVRGIPLGQTEGQRLVLELQAPLGQAVETILRLERDDFGVVSPGLEISQMRHEKLNIRLFMS